MVERFPVEEEVAGPIPVAHPKFFTTTKISKYGNPRPRFEPLV